MTKIIIPFFKAFLTTNKRFYKKIKDIVGEYPKNEELYKLAFIHRSASLKLPNGQIVNNERLEFLGDAVLDTIVAEYLYKKFPNQDEGFLTKTRSKMVNGDFLSQLSLSLGLDELIVSHVTKFNSNKHILADAFEAFVGAIYLDKGYNSVRKFVIKQIIKKRIDIAEVLKTETNHKSVLIEWSQKQKKEIVFNSSVIDEDASTQEFESIVYIDNEIISKGIGFSKKEAEQHAAEKALYKLT